MALANDVFYDATIRRYAAKKPKNFSINEMVKHSREPSKENIISSAQFVARQLPIRLAQRLYDMQALPWLMLQNPHIFRVFELYTDAFERIRAFEGAVDSVADNEAFCNVLSTALTENLPVVELLGKGVREVIQVVPLESLALDSFLDKILSSRINQRVMAEQHLTLRSPMNDDWRGVIHLKCSPHSRFLDSAARVTEQCIHHFSVAPRVEFDGDLDVKFPFIPNHLEYIATELLKNSMRATIEFHESSTGEVVMHPSELRPIKVTFHSGVRNLTIRISDAGGGVSQHAVDSGLSPAYVSVQLGSRDPLPASVRGLLPGTLSADVFKYGVTTAAKDRAASSPAQAAENAKFNWDVKATTAAPLAGYGFGLPLARLYARHFGGDIVMVSMPGYGTETFLTLDTSGEFYKRSL